LRARALSHKSQPRMTKAPSNNYQKQSSANGTAKNIRNDKSVVKVSSACHAQVFRKPPVKNASGFRPDSSKNLINKIRAKDTKSKEKMPEKKASSVKATTQSVVRKHLMVNRDEGSSDLQKRRRVTKNIQDAEKTPIHRAQKGNEPASSTSSTLQAPQNRKNPSEQLLDKIRAKARSRVEASSSQANTQQASRKHLMTNRIEESPGPNKKRRGADQTKKQNDISSNGKDLPPRKRGGTPPGREDGNPSAPSINDSVRLRVQLTFQDKKHRLLDTKGHLTALAKSEAKLITKASKLGNDRLKAIFAKDIDNWGKYKTTQKVPFGDQAIRIHFYMNKKTGEVMYPFDYKVKGTPSPDLANQIRGDLSSAVLQEKGKFSFKALRKKIDAEQRELYKKHAPAVLKSKTENVR
ncbi:MAG: hypothetical protein ACHQUC_06355, partial [Chlamydiales bacterium]